MSSSIPSTSSSPWPEWEVYVNKLRVAVKSSSAETDLCGLLMECYSLYKEHLRISSVDEALAVVSGYGCSALEIAFMWMGRWRPTSAVVLVYSTMGVDLKGTNTEIEDIVTKDSVDANPLTEKQLSLLSTLQKHASDGEAEISQELAVIQMLLVEQNTVAALKLGETCSVEMADMSEFQQLVDAKLKELQDLLEKADMLRLHTLRALLELLSPVQAASCIVGAYELVLALRALSETIRNPGG